RRQAVGGGHSFHVQPDLDTVLGGGPDHRELLLAPQADISLLGYRLERAELFDGRDELLVDRPEMSLLSRVHLAHDVVVRGAARLGGGLTIGIERVVNQAIGIPMSKSQLSLQHLPDLSVLGEAALLDQQADLCETLAGLRLDVLQVCFSRLVQSTHEDGSLFSTWVLWGV